MSLAIRMLSSWRFTLGFSIFFTKLGLQPSFRGTDPTVRYRPALRTNYVVKRADKCMHILTSEGCIWWKASDSSWLVNSGTQTAEIPRSFGYRIHPAIRFCGVASIAIFKICRDIRPSRGSVNSNFLISLNLRMCLCMVFNSWSSCLAYSTWPAW